MDSTYRIENARIIRVSDSGKAVLVRSTDFDKPVWIPVSQIHDNSEVYDINSPEGDMLVNESFAEYRKWI